MHYKVTLFILGLPIKYNTRTEIIEADTQDEAEKKAHDKYVSDGWGVLDSRPCTEDGEELVTINPTGKEEYIEIRLSKEKTPKAFENKVHELLSEGAFETREEAEKWVSEATFCLELYYEPHNGLFGVESEAVENGDVRSPYSGNHLIRM